MALFKGKIDYPPAANEAILMQGSTRYTLVVEEGSNSVTDLIAAGYEYVHNVVGKAQGANAEVTGRSRSLGTIRTILVENVT